MTLALIALFVFGSVVAFWLALVYQPPPPLTKSGLARFILCIAALALLSAVGLRGPLPVSVMYPIATCVLAVMLVGVVVTEKREQREGWIVRRKSV